ncbi:hypothetical protein P167DRAFT_549394 [Morchella conica CCBAS932]|uniref:Uncharacterized protein n=1 Tax=Morchella conica CCBAS932 TaxID=1392247 RepID=A0A3N4KEV8_9PEZI|nr:hypothetical protein P167DRAFT_549394 [Morchella conica CCBAS932]
MKRKKMSYKTRIRRDSFFVKIIRGACKCVRVSVHGHSWTDRTRYPFRTPMVSPIFLFAFHFTFIVHESIGKTFSNKMYAWLSLLVVVRQHDPVHQYPVNDIDNTGKQKDTFKASIIVF